jgi:hypothetical protein
MSSSSSSLSGAPNNCGCNLFVEYDCEGNDCIRSQSKANVKNKPLGFEGAGETNTIWGMFAHVQERAVVLNKQMKHLRPIDMSM